MLKYIEVNPKITPKASIIWLHGLGADANDFVDIIPQLNLAEATGVRFIFPHAPILNIEWMNHMPMPAWFNVKRLDRAFEDETGIRASELLIQELIQHENEREIPCSKIILAGFSQGGALALQCGLRYKEKLAGILSLSAWLPLANTLQAEKSSANQTTPILMQHGTLDDLIPLTWAEESRACLLKQAYNVKLDTYPMRHEVCLEEIVSVGKWLEQQLTLPH